jgi:hypothetical protein
MLEYWIAHSRKPATTPEDWQHRAGRAVECPNPATAILQAEILSQAAGNVGAIAFSRTGDPDVGKFEDAVVLKTFGDLSVDLTMLF